MVPYGSNFKEAVDVFNTIRFLKSEDQVQACKYRMCPRSAGCGPG